jgi:hypothetical protein
MIFNCDEYLTFQIAHQGCQMVYFQTENHNLGTFWRVFVDIQSIFLPFGIFYGHLIYVFCGHLVYFPDVVCFTKKNLAALLLTGISVCDVMGLGSFLCT